MTRRALVSRANRWNRPLRASMTRAAVWSAFAARSSFLDLSSSSPRSSETLPEPTQTIAPGFELFPTPPPPPPSLATPLPPLSLNGGGVSAPLRSLVMPLPPPHPSSIGSEPLPRAKPLLLLLRLSEMLSGEAGESPVPLPLLASSGSRFFCLPRQTVYDTRQKPHNDAGINQQPGMLCPYCKSYLFAVKTAEQHDYGIQIAAPFDPATLLGNKKLIDKPAYSTSNHPST